MTRAVLTETEKQQPYAEFYNRPSATIPESVLSEIKNRSYQRDDALLIENINDLLLPGYLPMETGYCRMANGSFFVAVRTELRNTTSEMINWWFDWHPKESLRYRIWFPESHFDITMKAGQKQTPNALPYWYTTHYPVEDIGLGRETLSIHFLPPSEFGFDSTRFDEANVETVICGVVGSVSKNIKEQARMCHLVRRISDGLEMRSRFWIGDRVLLPHFIGSKLAEKIVNTRMIKNLALPSNTGFVMAMHCAQEYNNLAQILPELYQTYGTSAC